MTTLLIIQFILNLLIFIKLIKRDFLYAIYFAVFYLYALPTLIVFGYFPDWLPEQFSPNVWMPFYWFCTFSLITFGVVLINSANHKKEYQVVYRSKNGGKRELFAFYFLWGITLLQCILLIRNLGSISYENMYDEEFRSGNIEIGILNMLSQYMRYFIFLYLLKIKSSPNSRSSFKYKVLFLFTLLLVCIHGFYGGSRSSLLAMFIGMAYVIFYDKKLNFKSIMSITLLLIVAGVSLSYLRAVRGTFEQEANVSRLYIVLNQDYTLPSMNLIGVIQYNMVNTWDAVCSVLSRALVFIDYPYLHETIGERVFSSKITAGTGYGMYIFTEGYYCLGIWGILYNGLIIGWMVILLRKIGLTNDHLFNAFIIAIVASLSFALVRSQSSHFFRNIYLYIIPCSIAYSWIMGVKIRYTGYFNHNK